MKNARCLLAVAGTFFLAGCASMKFGWEQPSQKNDGRQAAVETTQVRVEEDSRQAAAEPAPVRVADKPRQAAAKSAESTGIVWRQSGSKDFDKERPGEGLGVSREFDCDRNGGGASVEVYSLNKQWVNGTGDPGFDAHFRSFLGDFGRLATEGVYSQLKIDAPQDLLFDGQKTRVIRLTYNTRENVRMETYFFLTGYQGKLVKLLATFSEPADGRLRDSLGELLKWNLSLVNPN